MGGVVAIDPGKRTGWAVFDRGQLVEAGVFPVRTMLDAPPIVAVAPAWAVLELPQIYPRGGKGDPNDLIDLAVLVGDLCGYYRRHGLGVVLVKPRAWKGTVPKTIHNKRTLAKLTAAERAILPVRPRAGDHDHNMLDAVGLGLWQLEKKGQRQ